MSNSSLAYTRADLLRLRDLLEKKTGLYLPDEKLGRLEEPFKELHAALLTASPQEIIRAIDAGSSAGIAHLDKLVAAIATNETYFFRTSAHFQTLKDYLIPELVEKKKSRGEKTLRIWSAGCSTGEEPYSLAILLYEKFPALLLPWEIDILATDIDLEALEHAERGLYRPWSFRGVDPELIRKYWRPVKKESRRVDDRVRSLVKFRPLNLESDPYPAASNGTKDLDIIFCRNVTIYFRPHTIKKILSRFHQCLNEGGFLVTGAAEYSQASYRHFEARVFPETIVYQKPSPQAAAHSPGPLALVWTAPLPRPAPQAPIKKIHRPAAVEPNRPDDPVVKAVALISQGEVDAALVLLAAEAEKNPRDSSVCFLLGQLAADRHHLGEASYWLQRTVTLDPLNLGAHYFMGLLWMEEGKTDDALAAMKKTVYIDPNFALGHFYLGKIHKAQGKTHQARRNFAVVKSLLASAPLSDHLPGAEGITSRQLLTLVDKELVHEGTRP
ncbi:MAG TPA: CheR family methyltransferase [Candidatus Binatia bacterium]|jgi:chemotaxis protein methyltransferase CheR